MRQQGLLESRRRDRLEATVNVSSPNTDFNKGKRGPYTPEDIRLTTKGDRFFSLSILPAANTPPAAIAN